MNFFYQAVWYRSNVRLEGTHIIPEGEFEPYNPFDFYFSSKSDKGGRQSLYLDFLNVDPNDTNAIIEFCERFGILGDKDFFYMAPQDRLGEIIPNPNEVHINEDGNISYTIAFEDGPLTTQVSKRLNGLALKDHKKRQMAQEVLSQIEIENMWLDPKAVCTPLKIEDFWQAQAELQSATYPFQDQEWATEQIKRGYKMALINRQLHKASVHPNVKWDIQQAHPVLVWNSHTLLGILWLMMMLDFLGPGKILNCPWCDKFFLAPTPQRRFCSPQCGNSFKVRKHKQKKHSHSQTLSPQISGSGVSSNS